ncbi:histidine kinase [Dyadobacter luteus]|uniref:Histidine kinase n=1 Tax=Dyadobacter luteus TaxID=2259619 RepID=A0A3D8Y8U4_9BACT|nr:histidine kinase [Dyadobacter luteus]REA59754.1 histidine kinase [Dyadobacter luteus]
MEKSFAPLMTNRFKSLILPLFSFVMLYMIIYLLDPRDIQFQRYIARPLPALISEWVLAFFCCILNSEFSIYVNKRLNNFLSWFEKPLQRLFTEATLNIGFVFLLILLQIFLMSFVYDYDGDALDCLDEDVAGFSQWIIASVVIGLMILTFHTGNYLITNWKNTAVLAATHQLKAAEHKQAAAEAELEALRLQLDPHFVFNNLSVLSELILEDQKLGYEYAENFSKVYRYLLVNSKKDLIPLENELKFLNAYIFLLKHRVGAGIVFDIDISPDSCRHYIPPMSLQLLIENAIKHNKTRKENPLKIIVRTTAEKELVVINTIDRVDSGKFSSGLGLRNIKLRYTLLSDRHPVVTDDGSLFQVTIPLL